MSEEQSAAQILIIEDSQFFATMHQNHLSKLGYVVVVAEDGEKGLEAAKKQKPNLILLDLIMPIKDGFEVLKELKADENLKATPVIVMSELAQEEDIKKAKEIGAEDYIKKSDMSSSEIVEKIQVFLKSAS